MKHAFPICALLQLLFSGALAAQLCGLTYTGLPVIECVWWASTPAQETVLGFTSGTELANSDQTLETRPWAPVHRSVIKISRYKKGSFHGLHIPFEPSIGRLNFNAALPYRDTWMGGGYAGLDFGEHAGFRGFYFKAMNFGKIKIDEEKLSMYGGELRLRVPVTKGLKPTLLLGGGYLNVNGNYKPRDIHAAKSQFFAQTGLGLNLPLSDNVQLQCGARAILLSDPRHGADGLRTSCMYNLGIRLTLSKKMRFPFINFPYWNRQNEGRS